MKESKCQLAILLSLKIFNMKLVGKAIGYMISVFGLGLIIIGSLAFSDPQSVQHANDFDPFGVPPSFLQILEYIAIGAVLTAFGLWLVVRRNGV